MDGSHVIWPALTKRQSPRGPPRSQIGRIASALKRHALHVRVDRLANVVRQPASRFMPWPEIAYACRGLAHGLQNKPVRQCRLFGEPRKSFVIHLIELFGIAERERQAITTDIGDSGD